MFKEGDFIQLNWDVALDSGAEHSELKVQYLYWNHGLAITWTEEDPQGKLLRFQCAAPFVVMAVFGMPV